MPVSFNNIYTSWKESQQRYHNADIKTYEGRNQLFQHYLSEASSELSEFINGISVDSYFEVGVTKTQILRDQIEQAYFEENAALNLSTLAKKIMQDKKNEEVETALKSLIESDNYQRWLQLRYRCGLEEARRRALDDYLSLYKKDYSYKQPIQNQGPLFPRFEQVIQNSLYDAKSYAQGWIGYTAAATIYSVAYGMASLLKHTKKSDQEYAAAQLLRESVMSMDSDIENDALSYLLLILQRDYVQNFSVKEQQELQQIISKRKSRFTTGLIHTQDLDSFKKNNKSYTDWIDLKLKERHLSCQEEPLKIAMHFYTDLYRTHILTHALQQHLKGEPLDICQGVDNPSSEIEQMFFNNPTEFFKYYEAKPGASSEFIPESFGIVEDSNYHRFEIFDHNQQLAANIVHNSQNSLIYSIPMEIGSMLVEAAMETGQQFCTLQHRYLTGDKQGPTSGDDGLSEEVKRNLAGRRAPRPGQ